jgi:hypothetical protein
MKIGDKITCTDNSYAQELVIDDTYLILDINERGNFQLQNIGDSQILPYHYDPERFEPVDTQEIVVSFGGIKITLFNDRSVMFNGKVGTGPCSDEEIDNLINALFVMRDGEF